MGEDASADAANDLLDETQRIYIGGVDATRLTIREVYEKIVSDVGSVVSFRPMTEDELTHRKTFCHVEVSLKDRGSDSSPLEIIGKKYNNVKWKGCKVRIEAARPHFLDRLQLEREQRARSPVTKCVPDEEREPTKVRRHLRIRQGYGRPCYNVDTKPWEVQDTRTLGNLLARRKEGVSDVKAKHFDKRALHLRFEVPLKPISSSDDDCSEQSNGENVYDKPGAFTTNRQGDNRYEWSDSDDSSASRDLTVSSSEHTPQISEEEQSHSELEGNETASSVGLKHDVDVNIKVLRGIFSVPVDTAIQSETEASSSSEVEMVRYDPRTSDKERYHEPLTKKGTEVDISKQSSKNNGAEERTATCSEETTENAIVYEQQKLEAVFQEDRELKTSVSVAAGDRTGGFSFGFSLPADPSPADPSVMSIDFSVNKKSFNQEQSPPPDKTSNKPQTDVGKAPSNRPRRGLRIKDDELSAMVSFFYDYPHRVRTEEEDQADWEEKRLSLTQDWKRKHKLALSSKRTKRSHTKQS